jgi:hypothetical protein
VENPRMDGSVPCASKVNFSMYSCVKDPDKSGVCSEKNWGADDTMAHKNARGFKTEPFERDYCKSSFTPCSPGWQRVPDIVCETE